MGPKAKGKNAGKNPPPPPPEVDPAEVVTELERQFFEIQLEDIEKKIERIALREEELKSEIAGLEDRIDEYKREKGATVSELEQTLAVKEEEKIRKRELMWHLSDEIRIRVEQHKKHIEELEKKFGEMIAELTDQLERLEEEVRILEDFKQNKNLYAGELVDIEKQMEEAEMQHQRDLFEIERKWEMAKVRVKRELESKLLLLSIEFQETSRNRIGDPCHRVTQENKAIENELRLMRDEVLEYEARYVVSRANAGHYRGHIQRREDEREKGLAKATFQKGLVKSLLSDRKALLQRLRLFSVIDVYNKTLLKKLRALVAEIDKKTAKIGDAQKSIEETKEQIAAMSETSAELRRTSRRLQVLVRNALKFAEEAAAVRLIPLGGTEEEKYMNSDAKIRLFKKRRDAAFQKKGRILQYLLDCLANAQMSEEDKKLLRSSSGSLDLDNINFSVIYGKLDRDADQREASDVDLEKSAATLGSDVSLPRSISQIEVRQEETSSESLEGEFAGEFDLEAEDADLPEAGAAAAADQPAEEEAAPEPPPPPPPADASEG